MYIQGTIIDSAAKSINADLMNSVKTCNTEMKSVTKLSYSTKASFRLIDLHFLESVAKRCRKLAYLLCLRPIPAGYLLVIGSCLSLGRRCPISDCTCTCTAPRPYHCCRRTERLSKGAQSEIPRCSRQSPTSYLGNLIGERFLYWDRCHLGVLLCTHPQ